MSTLTVWKFDSPDGAGVAMRRVADAQAEGLLVVDDAAWVSWPHGGEPRAPGPEPGGVGGLSRRFWTWLFAALFLLPVPAAAVDVGLGAGPGAGFGAELGAEITAEVVAGLGAPVSLAELGIDDAFVREVRDSVVAGTSALFVVSHDAVVHRLSEPFTGTHAGLVQTHFSRAEEARLRAVFAPADAQAALPATGHVLPPS
ncbi:DUF1269 domain-containing protein [Puerhibacterium sp. TATVAM-FAB25]|uniref:DUF1269 domain-containing protein n=1 Tax=Puerhibacterium sp. TATVAM-FAB25 TaxID=3093699 RepID=UPI003979A76F